MLNLLVIVQIMASFAMASMAFYETEFVMPAARKAGFNGFNRYWARFRARVWLTKRVAALSEWGSLLPMLLFLSLVGQTTMAIILFMLTLAPWTIRLAAIIPVRKRLSLSYLPRAWKDYRRLERTSGAFWLLKTLVLGKLAADIFA